MSYLAVGLAVALAWFAGINAIVSLMVAVTAPAWIRRRARDGVAISPVSIAVLRFAPVTTAALFVLLWVAPAYWQLEPRHAGEQVGVTLAALAAAAGAILLVSLARAAIAVARTARTTRTWIAQSRPIEQRERSMAMFACEDEAALVALIGVVRPRLFLGRSVRQALTSDELSAVVAHELAHRSAFDNVTRLLFASCRDVLGITRSGRALERSWRAAAEQSADRRASDGDRRRAVHLASALVKVARLVPPGAPMPVMCSSLHASDRDALLPVRVRRLLAHEPPRDGSPLPAIAISVALLAAAILGAPAVRPIVHEATELLVRMLP